MPPGAVTLGRVREQDRRLAERGRAGGRRRRAGALPRVGAEVVVVAAGREERCLLAVARRQVEAEQVSVERQRVGDRGHAEVHVAHRRPLGEPVERLCLGILELGEHRADVERKRRHPFLDAALPALARPVGVDLDPVVVGIAEIDRLADEVVGETCQRDSVAGGVGEPAREARTVGGQEREVEEPGVAVPRPGSRLLDENEQLGAAHAERQPLAVLPQHPKADLLLVIASRALELGDRELDRAHGRVGRDRRGRGRFGHVNAR
jgi:hypothetical protein